MSIHTHQLHHSYLFGILQAAKAIDFISKKVLRLIQQAPQLACEPRVGSVYRHPPIIDSNIRLRDIFGTDFRLVSSQGTPQITMRRKQLLSVPLLTITLLLTHIPAVLAQLQPFFPAETATPTVGRYRAAAPVHELLARQTDGCISGTTSCANQGSAFNGICCADGQACALDADNSPACCPSGAVCTGTAPSSYKPPTTTAVSYVPNAYFSFPYIATSFSNAGACSRAVSQCSANYAACTADLAGGAGGAVTVVVPAGNGGTTTIGANAGTTLPTASATSVCQSLSSVACHSIQGSYCEAGSTAGFTVGSANAAPTHLPCMGVVAGVAAGVGFGMMGI